MPRQVDPREHARSIHGASRRAIAHAHAFANDNSEAMRLFLRVRGDCTIFQIEVDEEDGLGTFGVRVPIDFLHDLREPKHGVTWRDPHGTVFEPSGRTITIGLADRRGDSGWMIELDDLAPRA